MPEDAFELVTRTLTRRVLHAHQRALAPPDSGWGDMSYLRGSYDHLPIFIKAHEAMKEGLKELLLKR